MFYKSWLTPRLHPLFLLLRMQLSYLKKNFIGSCHLAKRQHVQIHRFRLCRKNRLVWNLTQHRRRGIKMHSVRPAQISIILIINKWLSSHNKWIRVDRWNVVLHKRQQTDRYYQEHKNKDRPEPRQQLRKLSSEAGKPRRLANLNKDATCEILIFLWEEVHVQFMWGLATLS